MTNIITQNFEGLTPPAVPSGTFTQFETAAGIGKSGSIGLRPLDAQTSARGEFSQLSGSADIDFSVDIEFVSVGTTGGTADAYQGVYFRSNDAAQASQTGYIAQFRLTYIPGDPTQMATVNGVRLVRLNAGALTEFLGSNVFIPISGLDASIFYRMRCLAIGANIKVYVQRPSDSFYLKPDGSFQSASVACMNITDTSPIMGTANDRFGLTTFRGSNATTRFVYDNVTFDTYVAVVGATAFTLTAPDLPKGAVSAASSAFTIQPDGAYTGTITPSSGGGGGTFTPTSLTWTGDAAAKTFTYTPATAGKKTISATASPALTAPSSVSYYGAVNGTAYISATGNDATGAIGNPLLAFATINAALMYLKDESSGTKNALLFTFARFDPVTTLTTGGASLIPSGTAFVGLGMPSVRATGRSLNETTGTVIDGPFGNVASFIEWYDLGIDSGTDVCAARYGGVPKDGFVPCVSNNQDPSINPASTGHIAKNIICLAAQGATTAHCFLSENASNCLFQNITCIFGFAVVAKTWNSVYRQFTCLGQGIAASYGFVAKTNAYSACHDLVIEDLYLGPFNGTGSGALSQPAGVLTFTNVGDGLNTTGNPFPDLTNIAVRGVVADVGARAAVIYEQSGSGSITTCTVQNLMLVGSATQGTATGTGNTIALIAAPVTSVVGAVNGAHTLATSTISPNNAPPFVRYSLNHGKIDTYTSIMDLTGVSGSVTMTPTSLFGAGGTAITGPVTFSAVPAGTVATPTFSPVGGSYTGDRVITLSCATSAATIYYTTDGTTPTTGSTPYTGTITVTTGTTVIKALAVKAALTDSAVGTATYVITAASGGGGGGVGGTYPTADEIAQAILDTRVYPDSPTNQLTFRAFYQKQFDALFGRRTGYTAGSAVRRFYDPDDVLSFRVDVDAETGVQTIDLDPES